MEFLNSIFSKQTNCRNIQRVCFADSAFTARTGNTCPGSGTALDMCAPGDVIDDAENPFTGVVDDDGRRQVEARTGMCYGAATIPGCLGPLQVCIASGHYWEKGTGACQAGETQQVICTEGCNMSPPPSNATNVPANASMLAPSASCPAAKPHAYDVCLYSSATPNKITPRMSTTCSAPGGVPKLMCLAESWQP